MEKEYRESLYPPAVPVAVSAPCPIERILIGSVREATCKPIDACAACFPIIVAATNIATLLVFSEGLNKSISLSFQAAAVRCVTARTVLIATETSLVLFDLVDAQVSATVNIKVALISAATGVNTFVVGVTDGSLLLLTVDTAKRLLGMRLLMAATPALGKMSHFAFHPKRALLAIATDLGLLVLHMVAVPRVVYKSLTPVNRIVWARSNLLVISSRAALQVDDELSFISIAFESPVHQIFSVDCDVLWELRFEGSQRRVCAHTDFSPGEFHSLAVSLPVDVNLICAQSLFSLTLRLVDQRTVSVDVHQLTLIDWATLATSLIHGEQFDHVFPFPSESIAPLLAKEYLKSHLRTNERDDAFSVFLARLCLLSEFHPRADPDRLVNLVLLGRVSVKALDGSLINRCIDALEQPMQRELMDKFVTLLILGWLPLAAPIDVDRVVRICIMQNLLISTVLVHMHLLQDFRFVFDYLRRKDSQNGQTHFLAYFLYCCTHKKGYPVWTVPALEVNIEEFLFEPDMEKKIKSLLPDKLFLSAVPTSPSLFNLFWSLSPPTVWDGRDDLIVYGAKSCALSNEFYEQIGISDLQLLKLADQSLVEKIIDSIEPGINVLPIIDQLEDDLALVFLAKQNFELTKVVQHCLEKGRYRVALGLLAERRDFDQVSEIMLNRDVTAKTLSEISDKYAEFIDPELIANIWASKLDDLGSVKKLDWLLLLRHVDQLKWVSVLYDKIHMQTKLQNKAKYLASLDVGTQFSILAKNNKRTAGIPVTATICHMCMDPILSKGKVQLYSCRHIVHSKCCDGITGKCPVCLHV